MPLPQTCQSWPILETIERKKEIILSSISFLVKLLHSGSCRSPCSTVQNAAPKSDIKTNKMKSLSVGKGKACGTSISEVLICSDLKPLNKLSWLRWARGNSATSSSRAKQGEDIGQQKEDNAPSLAINISKVQSSCHGGNEETCNHKALSEQPPCPQVQFPDGVSQPRDLKSYTGDDRKSDSPPSCQIEKVSPGYDWQLSRAGETVEE